MQFIRVSSTATYNLDYIYMHECKYVQVTILLLDIISRTFLHIYIILLVYYLVVNNAARMATL